MAFEAVENGTMTVRGQKLKYRITNGSGYESGMNGYIIFPKRPVRETDYSGILSYVPVHGGITYATEHKDKTMEYGFDTAHYKSELEPRNDVDWIKRQIRSMAEGIIRASEVEDKYNTCRTNRGKAKHVEYVSGSDFDLGNNFGAMINVLSGKL